VLVAVIGILGALMALQLERRVELGVLRALGFTPGQVRYLIMAQTGVMGLFAGLIALPTGLLLGGLLASGLGTAVLAALVAGAYPAWRMSRVLPAAALREP
jgi:putative ABC transport system permease protein